MDIKITSKPALTGRAAKASLAPASKGGSFAHLSKHSIEEDTALQPEQSLGAITVEHLIMLSNATLEDKKKAITYGSHLLEHLEHLRTAMINGTLSPSTLQDIRRLLNRTVLTALEPKLRALLDDIRIRAEVELAKWEQASKNVLRP